MHQKTVQLQAFGNTARRRPNWHGFCTLTVDSGCSPTKETWTISTEKKSLISRGKTVKKAKSEPKKSGKAIQSARGLTAKSTNSFRMAGNHNQIVL